MRRIYHRYDLPEEHRSRGEARMAGQIALLLLFFVGGAVLTGFLYALVMILSTALVAVQP